MLWVLNFRGQVSSEDRKKRCGYTGCLGLHCVLHEFGVDF